MLLRDFLTLLWHKPPLFKRVDNSLLLVQNFSIAEVREGLVNTAPVQHTARDKLQRVGCFSTSVNYYNTHSA